MRIILVRHAENGGKPFDCPASPVKGYLSKENGLRQAEELRKAFAGVRIDIAFSSPLGRALQTAESVLKDRNTPIKKCDFLKEWMPNHELKELPDTKFEKIQKRVANRFMEETWKTELGEGTFDMYARICPAFLKELDKIGIHARFGGFKPEKKAEDMNIAVFAHGGSLNILLSFLLEVCPFPVGRFSFRLTGTAVIEYVSQKGIYYPTLVIPAPSALF